MRIRNDRSKCPSKIKSKKNNRQKGLTSEELNLMPTLKAFIKRMTK
jgi:hypothetical protein